MPGAGRTHGPPATKKAGGSHHRFSRNNRHSPRDGFTAYGALSLVSRALLPPSLAGSSPANLTPASGCQDHTFLPSASATFV